MSQSHIGGQGLRLGPCPPCLGTSTGREPDQQADGESHEEKHKERNEVVGISDHQGVNWLGEEPVGQEKTGQGRDQSRKDAANDAHQDGGGQIEQQNVVENQRIRTAAEEARSGGAVRSKRTSRHVSWLERLTAPLER